jgi:hypothetical protein
MDVVYMSKDAQTRGFTAVGCIEMSELRGEGVESSLTHQEISTPPFVVQPSMFHLKTVQLCPGKISSP